MAVSYVVQFCLLGGAFVVTGCSVAWSNPLFALRNHVEVKGFEPLASCMPCKRSTGLNYTPKASLCFRAGTGLALGLQDALQAGITLCLLYESSLARTCDSSIIATS